MTSLVTKFGCAALAAGLAFSPLQAQTEYAQVGSNDLAKCSAGQGPAVRVQVSGLRSADGNLFVRIYKASRRDWLKGKRYLIRIDTDPRPGAMAVCVPIPGAGRYAIAVQHDENGNREMDISKDGAGVSNNAEIRFFLGIPRPPSVDKAAFSATAGVTPIAITMRYRN